MKIHLERVKEEPFRWRETEAIAAGELECRDLLQLSEVSWRGEVSYVAPGFLLRAELAYEQTTSCVRCLRPVAEELKSAVELLILVDPDEQPTGEYQLKREEMSTLVVAGEILDSRPILIEQLQLNIPMRTLCRPDCAGLCPTCGVDRNLTACDCEPQATDPRWAALAALRPPDR